MANISWTSSSINSFFNTSLGNPSSAFSGIYSSLGDASLIKSGVYHKLMDSYYSSLKSSDEASSDKTSSNGKTNTTDTKKSRHANAYTYDCTAKKTSSITNKVLDELLSDEKKESTVSNKVLDELLTSKKNDSAACTYNSTGTKTQTGESTIDQSI